MKRFQIMSFLLTLMLILPLGKAYAQGESNSDPDQVYISEVAISTDRNSGTAWNNLKNLGYTPVGVDLNEKAGGSYIYLGYKTTKNHNEALTNLLVFVGGQYNADCNKEYKVNECTYKPVKSIGDSGGDLNRGAGGKDLFLWYTKDHGEFGYITAVNSHSYGSGNGASNFVKWTSDNNTINGNCDLNWGAGGKFIYIEMQKTFYTNCDLPAARNAFQVTGLGGGLYQIDIPVGLKDDNATIVYGTGTDQGHANEINIQFLPKGNDASTDNAWKDLIMLNYVTPVVEKDSKEYFKNEWEATVYVKGGYMIYDGAFNALTQNKSNEKIKMAGGNASDLRTYSFLWNSNGTEFDQIRLKAKGANVENLAVMTSTLNLSKNQKKVAKEDDPMNFFMVMDPMLNLNIDDKIGNTITAGSQNVQAVASGKMLGVAIWDETEKKFIYSDKDASKQNYSCNLPEYEDTHNMVFLAYGEQMSISDEGKQSTFHKFYSAPFELKPFHAIQGVTVSSESSTDKETGKFTQKNIVKWKVENVRSGDTFDDDQYIVQRSYTPGFENPTTITTVDVSDISVSANSDCKVEIADDGTGTYSYTDEDENAWYNPLSKDGKGKIYYRVVRALAKARWQNADISKFQKDCSLTLNNNLSNFVNVSVQKNKNFNEDKSVTVRIETKSVSVKEPLNFKAIGGDVKISLRANGTLNKYCIQYSKDGVEWSKIMTLPVHPNSDNEIVTIPAGETYYFRTGFTEPIECLNTTENYWSFVMEGDGMIEAAGDVMSLLDQSGNLEAPGEWSFYSLFSDCDKLLTAPNIYAKKMNRGSCMAMYENCINLKTAPGLSVSEYGDRACERMFYNCRNLESIGYFAKADLPELCFYFAFKLCRKLKELHVGFTKFVGSSGAYSDNWSLNVWLDGSAEREKGILYVPKDGLKLNYNLPDNWTLQEEDNIEELQYDTKLWDPKAKIAIRRYSPSRCKDENGNPTGGDYAEKTYTISGDNVKWDKEGKKWYAELEDVQSFPYTLYYYEAKVDDSNSNFKSASTYSIHTSEKEAKDCYNESLAPITHFTASRGTEEGCILVEWEVAEGLNDGFRLERKKYSDKDAEWKELKLVDPKATTYVDRDVVTDDIYLYRVTSIGTFCGDKFEKSAITSGHAPYYGAIKGRLRLNNGASMPGKAYICIKTDSIINIKEVIDKEHGDTLHHAYQPIINDTLLVKPDGTFYIDSLIYLSSGTKYHLQVLGTGVPFTNPTGDDGEYSVVLGNGKHELDCEFVCNKTKQFSGRVLYEGSTVPVRRAYFIVNESVLRSAAGDTIFTDALGNFAFQVPTAELSIQVKKKGHKFVNEGYILSAKDNAEIYTPDKDRDGLRLYDLSKVRLVGRMVGGNVQGKKPLGFGLSQNNLGRDLTMVLELEGNNTAQFVYNPDDPDNTTRHETVTQHVTETKTKNGMTNTLEHELIRTEVNFEKRRIVVKPDVNTGEFAVDLFPAKYKITRLEAEGYATLFNPDEGFEVLELTEALSDSIIAKVEKETDEKDVIDTLTTQYNATYRRTYHVPVKVTYMQNNYGILKPNLGEEKFKFTNLANEKVTSPVSASDKKTNVVYYTFGYPVFKSGNTYSLQVSAHEDFYFDGDTTSKPDQVFLDGGTLIVRNGLESDTTKAIYKMDKEGKCNIPIKAANCNFSLTGKDALRTLSMQVEYNGYYYYADDLQGFVTGDRFDGTNSLPMGSQLHVLDVLRDPPGTKSFATREAGTEYSWNYDFMENTANHISLKLTTGPSAQFIFGFGTGFMTDMSIPITGGMDIVRDRRIEKKNGNYTLTLSDKVSTSDDPFDQGAIADVYIGTATSYVFTNVETVGVIDEATHKAAKKAIDSGAIKIVQEGKTSDGENIYLAISQKGAINPTGISSFVYSQRHILGTLIPQLERQRDALLRTSTYDDGHDLQEIANATSKPQYWKTQIKETGKDTIICLAPENADFINEIDTLESAIKKWKDIIKMNEADKISAFIGKSIDRHNVAGSTITHSEAGSTYWNSKVATPAALVTGSFGFDPGLTPKEHTDTIKKEEYKKHEKYDRARFLGMMLEFGLNYDHEYTNSTTNTYIKTKDMGYSYTIAPEDNGYLDVSVYGKTADFAMDPNLHSSVNDKGDYDKGEARLHNFIFYQNGGGSRNPWLPADTTVIYEENGHHLPLGNNTLKIDNPRIYVDDPVVSNLPQGERAVFSIRLVNESEMPETADLLSPSYFTLKVDEKSNPHGARLFIDGTPIGNGRTFMLPPRQSITKVIEVERGAADYNYEDLKLVFSDEIKSLQDEANISIHYLPSASPVHIAMPANKWVLNTLGAKDKKGDYYLPVKIDGYNLNHKDFDHIELQYKRQNEGDDKWVNLCSYYANDSLYNLASGTKDRIHGGSINDIRFYGEKDPVEAYYDLRAVSFSRLGTGYVTQPSEVVSGTKDTRCPEVFGSPKPANGIVTHDDIISLRFNENIAYNILDETANFRVQGYVNNTDADHGVSLTFPGNKDQQAHTKVFRNLRDHDFTIDLMAQVDEEGNGKWSLFYQEDEEYNLGQMINFFVERTNEGEFLGLETGNSLVKSVSLKTQNYSLRDGLTHVGAIVKSSPEGDSVRFFVGDIILGNSVKKGVPVNKVVGTIQLGRDLKGKMADVRLWDKALNPYEIANKSGKRLSSNEPGLLAYWPMNEGIGNNVVDVMNGADLRLSNVSWTTPDGYSLRLENKEVVLQNAEKFQRDSLADYSLSFWFKAEELKSDSVSIFRAGDNMLSDKGKGKVRINAEHNQLVLRSDSNVISFGEGSYLTDKQWHKATVVANHSHNAIRLFMDKNMVAQVDGDMMGGMTNEYISFGDTDFKGNVDNICFWRLALPASYITSYYNTSKTGTEADLAVNLAFERDSMKPDGTMITVFSHFSELKNATTGATILIPMLKEDDRKLGDDRQYAPIRSSKGIQNLPFTWTCTDTELQININKGDEALNHQHVNLVVRGVEDMAGNTLANPQMWSVYYDRNMLVWNNSKVNIEQDYKKGTTFNVGWRNKSGQHLSYTIENNTTWLQCETKMGQAGPMAEDEIQFSIDEGLSPGSHTATVYLTDENNLTSPLTINVTVIPSNEAEWEVVNNSDYGLVMNIIARVHINDPGINSSLYIDNDKRDVVAAFNQGVCLGKAHITYDAVTGSSYVFLTIRGKKNMNATATRAAEPIEFLLWNANRGEIIVLEPATEVRFASNTIVGTPSDPVKLSETNKKIQEISLAPGWNWISFNVKPLLSKADINHLFLDNSVFNDGDILKRAGDGFFYFNKGNWSTNQISLKLKKNIYQMYVSKPTMVSIKGEVYTDDTRFIDLKTGKGTSWQEFPYLLNISQPLSRALTDYQIADKAAIGTVIKSHDSFAVATATGWVGSLTYMYPGNGYYVQHTGDSCRINFTNNTPLGNPTPAMEDTENRVTENGMENNHESSMPLIAVFDEELDYREGDELVAYAKGVEVGRAHMLPADEGRMRFFLTVNAEEGDNLFFTQERNGDVVTSCRTMVKYSGNKVGGSIDSPIVIGLKAGMSDDDWYRLDGVPSDAKSRGIHVAKDKKVSVK